MDGEKTVRSVFRTGEEKASAQAMAERLAEMILRCEKEKQAEAQP